ncbi:kinase-like domain-containing protein [Hypoxylon trugodes]|uniref:kinase-like domain-containing protein n=1 Tax=Hypoxylon trugodes TaxID=326681 RepID=UPI00218E7769|nr:kinase-like domain-containing protein [Hypoxylon trugodes]KAI1383465.1 kinase-like domain-containing protein [Hypoxylon trugodes]
MCPLPFIGYNDTQDGESSAHARKACIHRNHIKDFQLNEDFTVAVKEIDVRDVSDKTYRAAIGALELARWVEEDHLVKFIVGFKTPERHYLIFQWADGGNLFQIWKSSQRCSNQLIHWAIEQMESIARGLEKLHNFDPSGIFYHGDLKPENVFVSTRPGHLGDLQIADMGSARAYLTRMGLGEAETMPFAGTIRYRPPEMKNSHADGNPRGHDIWSMGCMILEFIIWILYGPDGLEIFNGSFDNAARPFFGVDRGHGPLQHNVSNWIRHLRETCFGDDCASRALRDLLDFVHTKILVEDDGIENNKQLANTRRQNSLSPPRLLSTPTTTRKNLRLRQRRADISDLNEAFEQILSNKEADYFYCEGPAIKDSWELVLKSRILHGRMEKRTTGPEVPTHSSSPSTILPILAQRKQ